MKLAQLFYIPEACVEFTQADINLLMKSSQGHYDRLCRSLSENGGLIYGLNNAARTSETGLADRNCTLRDIDVLRKIMEMPPGLRGTKHVDEVQAFLAETFNKLSDEYNRMNPRLDDPTECIAVINGKECADRGIREPLEMCKGCRFYWTNAAALAGKTFSEWIEENAR